MGLDVYVGSFTRYYAGQWETIVQQAGRQMGFEVRVVHSEPEPADAITDPEEIRTGILRWRTALGQALAGAGLDGLDLNWREDITSPYFTDKPAWDCYGALQLLAACEETSFPLPTQLGDDWAQDPRLAQLSESRTDVRYSHLYGVEIWLPVEGIGVFEGPRPNGQPTRFGSSPQLLAQLQELNERTYRGGDQDLTEWQASQPDGATGPFEPRARTGLAMMLSLAGHAVRERLPMLLDY